MAIVPCDSGGSQATAPLWSRNMKKTVKNPRNMQLIRGWAVALAVGVGGGVFAGHLLAEDVVVGNQASQEEAAEKVETVNGKVEVTTKHFKPPENYRFKVLEAVPGPQVKSGRHVHASGKNLVETNISFPKDEAEDVQVKYMDLPLDPLTADQWDLKAWGRIEPKPAGGGGAGGGRKLEEKPWEVKTKAPKGVLGVIRHDGTESVDETKRSKPEPLPVDVDDANRNGKPDGGETGFAPNPSCLVGIKLHKIEDAFFSTCKYKLAFGPKVKVWKEKERTNAVQSGTTEFAVTADTQLYVEGMAHSGDLTGEMLELKTYSASGNPIQVDRANILVFEVKLKEFLFNHDTAAATADALNIRKSFTDALQLPEYVAGTRNGSAAYVRDKTVTVKAKFEVLPGGITGAKIAGRGMKADKVTADDGMPLGDMTEKTVAFTSGVTALEELTPTKKTPDAVDYSEKNWDWVISEVNGVNIGKVVIDRSAGHPIYTIWDDPKAPWTQTVGDKLNPWVSALELAIKKPGTSMQNDTGALGKTTGYLFSGHGLVYDTIQGAPNYNKGAMDMTGYISKTAGNTVNCYDQAGAVGSLARVIGINSELRFMQPFGYLNVIDLVGVGKCNNPFYSNTDPSICPPAAQGKPVVGVDDNRTGFGNHMYVLYGGKVFDACGGPSLGTSDEAAYRAAVIDKSQPFEDAAAGDATSVAGEPFPSIK